MDLLQEKITRKIKHFNNIIIHRHKFPDADALGSQGALQKAIQYSYPHKKVYVVGEEDENLKFMLKMDTIKDEVYKNALVIVLDTASTNRISDNRYSLGKYIIKIDHHPDHESYGDLNWVNTSYSSTSEMIYELIQDSFNLRLTDEAASLLYAGIVGDTGRFQFPNTSKQTMRYASELLRFNFSPQDFYNEFYKERPEVAKLKGFILTNYKVSENGVAHFTITKAMITKYKVTPYEASNLVNILSNIEGNHIWLFFIEADSGFRVRIRSKETVINDIARAFGGGGHTLAAGLSVDDLHEGNKLIKALDQRLKELKTI